MVVQLFCNVIAVLVSIRLNSFGAVWFHQASMKQQVYPRLRTIITVEQEASDRNRRNCDPRRFCYIIPRFIALLDRCISWSPSKVPWPQLPRCSHFHFYHLLCVTTCFSSVRNHFSQKIDVDGSDLGRSSRLEHTRRGAVLIFPGVRAAVRHIQMLWFEKEEILGSSDLQQIRQIFTSVE